jgi:hypothetical protein
MRCAIADFNFHNLGLFMRGVAAGRIGSFCAPDCSAWPRNGISGSRQGGVPASITTPLFLFWQRTHCLFQHCHAFLIIYRQRRRPIRSSAAAATARHRVKSDQKRQKNTPPSALKIITIHTGAPNNRALKADNESDARANNNCEFIKEHFQWVLLNSHPRQQRT